MLAERDISSVSVTDGDGNDDDSDRLKLRVLVGGSVMEAVADVVVDGDWPEREKVGEKVPWLRDMVIEPAVIDTVVEIVEVPVGSSDTVQVPEPDRVGYESLSVKARVEVGVGGGVTVLLSVKLTEGESEGEP